MQKIQTIAHIDGASSPADGLIRAVAIFGGGNDKRSLGQHQFRLGLGNLQLSTKKKGHTEVKKSFADLSHCIHISRNHTIQMLTISQLTTLKRAFPWLCLAWVEWSPRVPTELPDKKLVLLVRAVEPPIACIAHTLLLCS